VENDVERACQDLLNLGGYKIHRLHCGRARFPDGLWVAVEEQSTPDWIAIHPQHPGFYVETKLPRVELSPAQVWMHRVLTTGWRLHVAVIDDLTELAECSPSMREPPSKDSAVVRLSGTAGFQQQPCAGSGQRPAVSEGPHPELQAGPQGS
jgi:hypothetical protein